MDRFWICYWNSDFRFFELPHMDLVPTIEEYEIILRLPLKEEVDVYLYKGNYVSRGKIASLIGLSSQQTELVSKGATQGWNKDLLEDHMISLAEKGDWEHFNKTLALLIYGLVLFPFTMGLIDQAAMDVFFAYETQKKNPVPAILADSLLSLEVCHQKKRGMLRCCNHLLYVWIMTHLYASNHMGYMPDPLRSFHRIPVKKLEASEWKGDLLTLKEEHFTWVCPWFHPRNTIFSCGDFLNVPLMGSRGCVAYTPTIALRQLKWTQFVPQSKELGGLSFQYAPDNMRQQAEVRAAWGKIKKKGEAELGKPRVTASSEYKEWRKARRISIPILKEVQHKESQSHETNQALASLTSQLEVMKAQMRLMEEKEERAQTEIEILKRQCQKKDMEIEHLKNECADAYENSTHVKKDQLKSDVNGLHLIAKHHREKVKEWIKTCGDMTEAVQKQVESLKIHVHEVNEEINSSPGIKLPWKIFKLVKFCQNLARSLM
ncbi:uncharacterized protein LOC109793946 [Cajanus cajan]|uniref:uncharacterized protein LOC109793946 n=1 Tax=Cajanus cajan TaxID=3821 RepID=UPI00098DB092|nr:uncharacterized protein LOC109793946 [Cajanus cajan]